MDFPRNDSKKFALLIVNTWQLPNALSDILYIYPILIKWGYEHSNITILVDRNINDVRLSLFAGMKPSPKIVIAGKEFLKKYNEILSDFATRSEGHVSSLFINISGHGAQIKDYSGDEIDGLDEYIIPNGTRVLDDDLLSSLMKNIPSNFYLFTGCDTCHSGTMFDFPYQGESLVNPKFTTTPFTGISISACSDKQLDYEIGCDYNKVLPIVKNMKFSGLSNAQTSALIARYETLLRKFTTTGALTSAFVERSVEKITDSSIRAMEKDLAQIGQTLVQCSTHKRAEIPSVLNQLSYVSIKKRAIEPSEGSSDTSSTSSTTNGTINSGSSDDNGGLIAFIVIVIFVIVVLVVTFVFVARNSAVFGGVRQPTIIQLF